MDPERKSAPLCADLAVLVNELGPSDVHADAENGARLHAGLYEALRRENLALQARVAYLEKVGQFGAVNAPVYERPRLKVWM